MRLRSASISKGLTVLASAFADLEETLAGLDRRLGRVEFAVARATPLPRGAGRRRPVRLTPARRAQLKLQGQYMGTMRGLTRAQKAKVKAVKERRGMEAAIKVARRLAAR
jgi:hypothetical protein